MTSELTKNFESFLDNNTPGGYVQTSISISDDNLSDRINEVLNTKGYLTSNSHLPWNQIDNKPIGTYITNINNLTGSNISITGSNIAVSSNNNTTIAAAINNLNTAINGITGDIGDITIGDENIVESISVNGNNIQPDNDKNINITIPIIDNEFNKESNNALSSVGLYNLLKQCCYPVIFEQPEDQLAAIGDTIYLSTFAQGYGNIQYQWQKIIKINNNDPIITNLGTNKNETYVITQVENFDFDNTYFSCSITDGFNNNITTNIIKVSQLFIISFNANGGIGDMDILKVQKGYNAELPINVFTNENYHFQGWSTTSNGAVVYQDQEIFMPINDIVLYAVWQ